MKNREITINENGHLLFGGCDTTELAKQYGTPAYIMDESIIRKNMKACIDAMASCFDAYKVFVASKAFLSAALCTIAGQEGLGIDVVSAGELQTALSAGFPADAINFHGNAKTMLEIEMAVKSGCCIVVDGLDELEDIENTCKKLGKKIPVAVRVTPGIEAHTHEYIQTGTEDTKFALGIENGMAIEAVNTILKSDYMQFEGINCHIGSQIMGADAYYETGKNMAGIALTIKEKAGVFPPLVNLGGGFGIVYIDGDEPSEPKDYIAQMKRGLEEVFSAAGEKMPVIGIEPGRYIVGEAGITLYTVCGVKDVPGVRKFVSVDGGMGDNPRVMLYQAKYDAVIANKAKQEGSDLVSVAGRFCETGDMLIYDIKLQNPQKGDILAVFSTGAYNYAMASNYNKATIPPVVLVKEGKSALMVRGQSIEEMVAREMQPEWL